MPSRSNIYCAAVYLLYYILPQQQHHPPPTALILIVLMFKEALILFFSFFLKFHFKNYYIQLSNLALYIFEMDLVDESASV